MELKGLEVRKVKKGGFGVNPFNGIESYNFLGVIVCYQILPENPFNGIERN